MAQQRYPQQRARRYARNDAQRGHTLNPSNLGGLRLRPHLPSALALGIVFFVLFVVTVAVPETGPFDRADYASSFGETRTGTVREVTSEQSVSGAGTIVAERFIVDVDGDTVVIKRSYVDGQLGVATYEAGDRVLVTASDTPSGIHYGISDYARGAPLLLLGLLFAVLVMFIGRWHGIGSLLGLAASVLVIGRFVIPGLLAGLDPVAIAIVGAIVLITTTLLLAHGPNLKTTLAIVSTALSLLLTGVLASFTVHALHLSGLADEESALLIALSGAAIDAKGLLLAGFVIGALGVLDDVTATQVSAVSELRSANASLSRRELYSRAMNIGRDHVASTVNTLVLAYAGAALPLMLLIAMQGEAILVSLQRELVATEIARALAGSIGIVAAVPISTALGALVLGGTPPRALATKAPGSSG